MSEEVSEGIDPSTGMADTKSRAARKKEADDAVKMASDMDIGSNRTKGNPDTGGVRQVPQNKVVNLENSFDDLSNDSDNIFKSKTAHDMGMSLDNINDFSEINDQANLHQEDVFESMAQNQTKTRMWGNALAQTAAELTLGTAEAATYLIDIPGAAKSLFTGEDYTNWAAEEIGKEKDRINEEAFNVYKTKKAKEGFALSDASWWTNNIATIASTATIFVPGLGATKLASWMGKGMKVALSGRVANINKLAKLDKFTKGANRVNEFVNARRTSTAAKTLISGGTSRFIEGTMEAGGTAEEYKANFIAKWKEDNPDKRVQDMPDAEWEQMEFEAAGAALSNFRLNLAMLPIDLMQAGLFFGTFGKGSKVVRPGARESMLDEMAGLKIKGAGAKKAAGKVDDVVDGASDATKTATKTAAKTGEKAAKEVVEKGSKFREFTKRSGQSISAVAKKLKDANWVAGGKNVLFNAASEATEEGYQYMSSKWSQKIEREEKDWSDALGITLKEGVNDPEFYTSMFFGAFGGVALGNFLPGVIDGLGIGVKGWKGEVTNQDVVKERMLKARAQAIGDKGGYHRVDANVMKGLSVEHAFEGRSDELQMALDENIRMAEENPEEYSIEDLDELKNKSKMHKEFSQRFEDNLMRSDFSSAIKKALTKIDADFVYGKNVLDQLQKEYDNSALEGDKLDAAKFQLEYLQKIIKEGNVMSRTAEGTKIFNDNLKALTDQIAEFEQLKKDNNCK